MQTSNSKICYAETGLCLAIPKVNSFSRKLIIVGRNKLNSIGMKAMLA